MHFSVYDTVYSPKYILSIEVHCVGYLYIMDPLHGRRNVLKYSISCFTFHIYFHTFILLFKSLQHTGTSPMAKLLITTVLECLQQYSPHSSTIWQPKRGIIFFTTTCATVAVRLVRIHSCGAVSWRRRNPQLIMLIARKATLPDLLESPVLSLILRRSRTGTVWFYTSSSNKRAARPKLYTKSLTRDLKRMYSRLTLVSISINLYAPCVLYIGTGVSLLFRERFLYI